MDRKLQIFISSTFTDLRDERQAAVEAVLRAKHIPAGMELFSAGDASQLEVIKEWIENSDAYMLILGARYGSIEPVSGLSYIEVEYNYAVSKGLPHFAVVLSDLAAKRKRESGFVTAADDAYAEQLRAFRQRVLNKTSSFVDDPRDIKLEVLQSLHNIEKRPGLVGWVRPNDDEKMAVAALKELNASMRSEIEQMKSEIKSNQPKAVTPKPASLDDGVTVVVQRKSRGYSNWFDKPVATTWGHIFGIIAIKLLEPTNDETLDRRVASELGGYDADASDASFRVRPRDWETVKAQFLRLDFVAISYGQTIMKTGALFWTLTPLGREVGLLLRSIPAKE